MQLITRRWVASALGLLALPAAGCTDVLEENPLGNLSSANYYQNEQDALTALNGAYQALHEGGANGYVVGRNYVFMLETPTPQVVSYSGISEVRGCWDVYMCTSTNDEYARTSWISIFRAINWANAVIDNVPNIQNMNAGTRSRIVAEAKFLRAFHYFNAVRLWGGVPLFLNETASLKDLDRKRNTADEVYAQVVKDLTEAMADLPVSYPASEYGRATRGAAQTLLGKVYLQRGVAGQDKPFGGNNLYWPTAQASDLQNAITQLREVVNGGRYRLVTNYGDLWNEATEQNSEVIWSVQNINQGGQGMDVNQYLAPRNTGWINTWTSAGAELPFWQSYHSADKRRDVTWLPEYVEVNGVRRDYRANGPTNNWPTPSLRKYLIERRDVTTNPRDLVVLRHGDVLLMLAEALYRQNPGSVEALQLVNQVRARAGVPALSSLSLADLYWERNWELASEQHAWYDAQRFWELFRAHVVANAQLGVTNKAQYPIVPKTVPFLVPTLTDDDRLMPIPQEAIDRNSNLQQNPGYS